MRLSQTPKDIADHQRRISDSRRISLGVGAAWMSGKLEPRAWPGENQWGHGAPVTPRYPQVGQPPSYTGPSSRPQSTTTQRDSAADAAEARRAFVPSTTYSGTADRGGPGRSYVESSAAARLDEIVRLFQDGTIATTDEVVQRIMTALGLVDRNTALKYYETLRSRLVRKTSTLPGRADKKGGRNGIPTGYDGPPSITPGTEPWGGRAPAGFDPIQPRPPQIWPGLEPYPSRLPVKPQDGRNGIPTGYDGPPQIWPGLEPYPSRLPVKPQDALPPVEPQDALPPGKTYGGRTTIKKRRSGKADRPEEARITAGWDVANQGDVTAKASLRLRMGATRILATSVPVDVIAGSRKSLALRWGIPSDMAIGGHNLSLDIMQTWQADGSTHKKLIAVHEVTVSIV